MAILDTKYSIRDTKNLSNPQFFAFLRFADIQCIVGCNGSTNETHERAYPKSPFAPRNRRARVFKMPFMRRGRFGASRLYRLRHVPRAADFECCEKESQGGKARESESRSKKINP